MSEFHNAFYITCKKHDVEHPKWRKCPKCEEIVTYSEEEMISFAVWCGVNYISYHSQRDGERIWFDPDNVRYYKTSTLLKIWKEQNK